MMKYISDEAHFREDFDHYPVLFTGLERALCPRVHFKILVFDCEVAHIGSANLTGAGILTDEPEPLCQLS